MYSFWWSMYQLTLFISWNATLHVRFFLTSCPSLQSFLVYFKIFCFIFKFSMKLQTYEIPYQDPVRIPNADSDPSTQKQGCGSVFIWYGSGSTILGWIPIRIRIQSGSNPDPRFWWPEIEKKLQLKKKLFFFYQKLKFTYPWASKKYAQAIKEAFSSQKRTSNTSKHEIFLIFFYFCGSFLPSWIRIRIPNTDPDPLTWLSPDPQPCVKVRILILKLSSAFGIFLALSLPYWRSDTFLDSKLFCRSFGLECDDVHQTRNNYVSGLQPCFKGAQGFQKWVRCFFSSLVFLVLLHF